MLQMLLYFLSPIQQISVECNDNTHKGQHYANIDILSFVRSLSLASLKVCS